MNITFVSVVFGAILLGGCSSMKPAPLSGKVEVQGHRGSRGTHPENTLVAFREAIAAGADVLELDLQLTKDDVVVVAHDPLLEPQMCRDAKGKPIAKPIPIRTLTLKQLKTYDCGSLRNPRFPDQKLEKAPIPTLEEVILFTAKEKPGIPMNIETKMVVPGDGNEKLVPEPQSFVEKIVAVLRRHARVSTVILQSFDFRTLEAAKRIEPNLKLACLFENEKDFCARTAAVGAQFASPFWELVTEAEVAACHAKNIQVVPWTPNRAEDWDKLLTLGVDAIITDYPRNLVTHLAAKKKGK